MWQDILAFPVPLCNIYASSYLKMIVPIKVIRMVQEATEPRITSTPFESTI
jgi:hypothetical protein